MTCLAVPVAASMRSFVVWIAMGSIGGARAASYTSILTTLSIDLRSGGMGPLKPSLSVTWVMFFTLGHSSSGRRCPDNDVFGDRRMTIIHVNGIFEHCVRFCKCLGANSEHIQLFDHRLFSSTFDRPETAFTLDVLEYYGIDAMECKTSAQSFFQKLRRVTNNAFPEEVPVRSHFKSNEPTHLFIFDNRTDTMN